MIQIIDTHTHLYLPEFDNDRDEAVQRAIVSGVKMMLMPNIDIHSVDQMILCEEQYPGICFSMTGLHPIRVLIPLPGEQRSTSLPRRFFALIFPVTPPGLTHPPGKIHRQPGPLQIRRNCGLSPRKA